MKHHLDQQFILFIFDPSTLKEDNNLIGGHSFIIYAKKISPSFPLNRQAYFCRQTLPPSLYMCDNPSTTISSTLNGKSSYAYVVGIPSWVAPSQGSKFCPGHPIAKFWEKISPTPSTQGVGRCELRTQLSSSLPSSLYKVICFRLQLPSFYRCVRSK